MEENDCEPGDVNRAPPPLVLLKFGTQHHLAELLDEGILFMRRADHFSKLEEDQRVRADPWEGYDVVGQPGRGKLVIRFEDGRVMEPKLVGPVLINRGWFPIPHVYCMTAITDVSAMAARRDGTGLIATRVREFGDQAVVIHDVPGFVDRVRAACSQEGLQYEIRVVRYVADDHNGEIDYFTKRATYEWQNECRIAVIGNEDGVLRLRLGPLHDVAVLLSTDESLSAIEYVPPGDGRDIR